MEEKKRLILDVQNLTKRFNNFTAVDHVTFQAHRGEIFGLLGPNGAGKTTTIRVISTVLSVTDGMTMVDGFDIRKEQEEVKKRLGVLTTDVGVYERFSGRENLQYFAALYSMPKEKTKARIAELSGLLDMDEFIDRRSGLYSTGMKQKLAIARSVIHDPDLVFFDEPTAGLDVLAARTVVQFMQRMKELGKCVVFSTHILHEAEKLCAHVAIIHRGIVVGNGTVETLKNDTKTSNLEDAFLALVQKGAHA